MNLHRAIRLAGFFCFVLAMSLLGSAAVAQPAPPPPPAAPNAPDVSVSSKVEITVKTTVQEAPKPAAPVAPPGVPVVAIFVRNANVKQLDGKVDSLEASIGSKATEKGFSILSRADALNSVSAMAKDGANVGNSALPGAQLDALLSNNSSALALGRNMGADYLMVCTAVSFGQDKKAFSGYGVDTLNVISKLRLSFTLQSVVTGASVPGSGGTVEATKTTRWDKNAVELPDVINDLIDEAATKLVEKMPLPSKPVAAVEESQLTINCNIQGLDMIDIVRNDAGEVVVGNTKSPVQATNATVELDGIIIGTASGSFPDVELGLHKIRITAKGSDDWNPYEGTVKINRKGMTLNIDLHQSDKGYAKWKEMMLTTQALKMGTKLTDAQVNVLNGYAQMLRQSGYKVDYKADHKSNITVNTTQPTTIIKNQAQNINQQ